MLVTFHEVGGGKKRALTLPPKGFYQFVGTKALVRSHDLPGV
jgi:hypothetical protein